MTERLQMRVHGAEAGLTLVYLPGLHGDWTLVGGFRRALGGRARFVEFTYPRTLEWSLEDYGAAVEEALVQSGIHRGWVIGESFASQIAWALARRHHARTDSPAAARNLAGGFDIEGVILAGGFVRHPSDWEVRCGLWCNRRMPIAVWRLVFSSLVKLARVAARRNPAFGSDIEEFAARRTEADLRAIQHRLELIHASNLCAIACGTSVPVYQLTALGDFIVPWTAVRRWLRAHCPGYRATRVVAFSTHAILFSKPRLSVEQILEWIRAERERGAAKAD